MSPLKCCRPVLFVLLLLCCGCASKNKGRIEGTTWTSLATTMNGVHVPAGMVTLEFTATGALTLTTAGERYTGRYSLGFGDNVTFSLDQELEGQKVHYQRVSITGTELTLIDSDGTRFKFQKAQ
jgi:hypothetical protein